MLRCLHGALPKPCWHWLTGGTFDSATGGTFQRDTGGTFHSDTPGTFESDMDGTFKVSQSIGRCFAHIENIKRQSLFNMIW